MRISPGYCMMMEAMAKEDERQKKEKEFKIKNNIYGSVHCPMCGRDMKLREGKYGTFWGCSNYPRCTGTKKI